MGLYIVAIEGPHNVRIEQRLRIWPQLELHDWQPYYLPGPYGSDTVAFSISVPPDHRVIAQPGVEGVTVAPGDIAGWYTVSVRQDKVEAPLFLEAHQLGSETVRLTFNLNVARLRWKLTTNEATDGWSTAPIQLPVDKLLQSQTCYLTLELATDAWPAIVWHLGMPVTSGRPYRKVTGVRRNLDSSASISLWVNSSTHCANWSIARFLRFH